MKKFICSEVTGLERAMFPKNELFQNFFFNNFAYFFGINFAHFFGINF